MGPKSNKKKINKNTENQVEFIPVRTENIKVNKISFDVYFNILCTRAGGKILPHHRSPIESFLKQFGDINSQTMEWFEGNFAKY